MARPAALLFKGATVSYGQLDTESTAFAAALWSLGVRKGDRVALLLPNCPQFLIAEFGAWKTGAVVVAVNPTYTERELEQVLDSTRAETVVTLTPFYERVKRVQGRAGVKRVIATSIKEYLPAALRLLFTLFKEAKDGHRITLAADDFWLQDLLARIATRRDPTVTVGPDDRAVILSSGGTTGTPKGVVGLHRHYVAAGLQLYEWTKSAKQPWVDVIMLPLPLFHVYANVGVQPLAFVGPNPLSLVPNPRDIDDLLKTIKQVKPAFFNGVPTLYTAMLNHPDVRAGKVDLSSIRLCFCGASALMAETKRQFEEKTGAVMLEGYSLTEGMMACCVNPVQRHEQDRIDRPAAARRRRPHRRRRGSDAGDADRRGRRADPARAAAHARVLEQPARDGGDAPHRTTTGGPWLHTGDLAYMDEDGYVFLVDRKKDMMKTSGFQVWPREIEEVIAAHPAVLEVGVAGVPDAVKGEVAKAWVVLKPDADARPRTSCAPTAASGSRRTRCRRSVEFRTELPEDDGRESAAARAGGRDGPS